ncbi:MAG TPA: DNA-formamidopyrimidine glycosylase family protein, partial [Pyrinomonadaceae bacterium]|nr:DNA-formamidopyrimidine glycosylase family protein [Pyrinomonadaceae bacterium]
MPELPDIVVYIEALEERILHHRLERVALASPFLLRTAEPPLKDVEGHKVLELRRIGKRICLGLEENFWLVFHLMIAGRFHWKEQKVQSSTSKAKGTERAISRPPKNHLARFNFSSGTLSLTEAGTQRRASLHVVRGEDALAAFDPGGLEIFDTDLPGFSTRLLSSNHTLKRALSDPRLFSGIGNAYSDEILWTAELSPIAMTQKLTTEEVERLFNATRSTLTHWIKLLREELVQSRGSSPTVREGARGSSPTVREGAGALSRFPEKVTAFRPEMAVHGKYQEPCPRCGDKVQRIRYASNETNYCPTC